MYRVRYFIGAAGLRGDNILYFYVATMCMAGFFATWMQDNAPAGMDPNTGGLVGFSVALAITVARFLFPIVELIVTLCLALIYTVLAFAIGARAGEFGMFLAILVVLWILAGAWEYLKNINNGKKRWALAW